MNEKEERNKPIQFYVSEREFNEILEYSEIAGNSTKSEFIRQALIEKIMRMKNPDMFEKTAKLNGESKITIQTILEGIGENKEKIDLMLRKVDLILDTQKNLEIISSRIKFEDLNKIDLALEKFLAAKNKSLKLSEISKSLKTSEDEILKALSIKDINGKPKYRMSFKTGGFEKND